MALAVNVCAEDKISADIDGDVEVEGIDFAGVIVGDAVPSYAKHDVHGKVSVVTKEGEVHRVETYTEWNAQNGVRGIVWERLYVSGGSFTGWTERFIQAPGNIIFSRNVINGDIEQEINLDGSGFVEWTVTGSDNSIESDDSSDESDTTDFTDTTDSSADLPTVDILEQGAFDGVSDRRIEIDAHDHDRSTITFRDKGYARVKSIDVLGSHQVTVNQKLELKGHGKGSIAFVPEKKKDATPDVTPTPTPVPAPTPIQNGTTDTTDFTDTVDGFGSF